MARATWTFLRFLRAHPWWTGTAALAFLVFGGWWAREEWARRSLLADIAEWRESRAVVPAEGPVPMEENAVAAWVEAIRAMRESTVGDDVFAPGDEYLEAVDLAAVVKANAPALALLDASLDRPLCVPPEVNATAGGMGTLTGLTIARARVQTAEGDRSAALRSLLAVHRMKRMLGRKANRYCSISMSTIGYSMTGLFELVEGGGLGEDDLRFLLHHCLRPEEFREFMVAGFEDVEMEAAADWLERAVRPGGKEWCVARGWTFPTLEQRILRPFGKAYPPGVEEFPSAVEMRQAWDLHTRTAATLRRRGWASFPLEERKDPNPGIMVSLEESLLRECRRAIEVETFLSLLRGAAAVRLHQVRTGSLPGNWENLVPSILESVPADPFTGGTLTWTPGDRLGVLRSDGPPPEGRGTDLRGVPGREDYSVLLR